MKAVEIMTENVITVGPKMKIKEVAQIMIENSISGLPVIEDDKLVGIISEGDLIVKEKKLDLPDYIYVLGGIFYLESFDDFEQDLKKMAGIEVADLMTKDVITVGPQSDVMDIATIFVEEGVNRVPVVKDNKLLGIVTRADIIRYMQEE
ncbi:CBS-domain-containing membrane protein [Halobacteroides halobius DSM 5150]|uniref:CBS-domain-containing membrane protein n=1 Tax=Halobacteroides halobius (strain ATCC 35273 / DSM 5150 / MD-1) TaxID=748449 RepID=L0K877_HALHC|nr:CBS domain-containing protein [Halobacteroides halobius]AGB40298.1 CBS-domain-containing membrane protein [Halobacteroides halobius DSM 5150]